MLLTLTYPSEALEEWMNRVRGRHAWHAPAAVSSRVGEILEDVQKRGDDALVEWVSKLDGRTLKGPEDLRVSEDKLQKALDNLAPDVRHALELANQRIEAYHRAEKAEHRSWSFTDRLGVTQGRIVRPVQLAGIYAPGGKAGYPSSVLMNLIPARVAGVPHCLMCSPWPDGNYFPETLAAARLAGCNEVYSIGGAVAIAAMAFGTETMPSVDIVTGPGNIWVAEAKRQVFGRVGIDLLAGPTEVVVVADETANPIWVAADLCAQAEHDPLACAVLITTSERLLDEVKAELDKMVCNLSRREIVEESFKRQGAAILVPDTDAAMEIVNRLAPEHLQLAVNIPGPLMEQVKSAGAVFIGHCVSEVFGDYTAGSNHVLPTGGTARFFSPLGISSFMTEVAFVECSLAAAKSLADPTSTLAHAEGLTAHALAASLRGVKQDVGKEKDD